MPGGSIGLPPLSVVLYIVSRLGKSAGLAMNS